MANFAASFGITGQMVVDFVNKLIIPNIEKFLLLVQKVLPLGFATALILEKCSNPNMTMEFSEKEQVKDIKTELKPLHHIGWN